jgi:hypothetical protein
MSIAIVMDSGAAIGKKENLTSTSLCRGASTLDSARLRRTTGNMLEKRLSR